MSLSDAVTRLDKAREELTQAEKAYKNALVEDATELARFIGLEFNKDYTLPGGKSGFLVQILRDEKTPETIRVTFVTWGSAFVGYDLNDIVVQGQRVSEKIA